MAVVYDQNSNKITMPIGDTYTFNVNVSGGLLTDGDIAMFAISNSDGEDALCKTFTINGGRCTVRLNSADTVNIEKGSYTWNIRLLHGAKVVDGKVEIDDSDEVITVWNKAPKFQLIDGGCDV